MVCKACGRNVANENANYCEYCGTSFREIIPVKPEDYLAAKEQQSVEINNEENEKEISFGNWLGTMMIPFIPIVGIFIYLVMMFVWAFGNETPKSKRNWARASLIVSAVGIILLFFMIFSTMMDLMNSGINLQNYMSEFY